MKWKDIWQQNWNSKLTHPNDGLNHNYCRNIIGSQFPQPWCMVQKPMEGPTAVQCSIPKCDQRQRQVDIFPTPLPLIITSTSTAYSSSGSNYGSTEGSTIRPASTYVDSTLITTSTTSTTRPNVYNPRTYAATAGTYSISTEATLGFTSPMTGKQNASPRIKIR